MHSTQEWYDLYNKSNVEDFKKFLDYHTKGVQNGWEQTPRARVSILRYNQVRAVQGQLVPYPSRD